MDQTGKAVSTEKRTSGAVLVPPKDRTTVVDRLADRLGVHSGARTLFADPVEHDGVTVIPVGKVRYGFGGGGGARETGQQGGGGGGFVQMSPVGYIELRKGKTTFRRARTPGTLVQLVLAAGLITLLIMRQRSRHATF